LPSEPGRMVLLRVEHNYSMSNNFTYRL